MHVHAHTSYFKILTKQKLFKSKSFKLNSGGQTKIDPGDAIIKLQNILGL